jgi:hypothetical protein
MVLPRRCLAPGHDIEVTDASVIVFDPSGLPSRWGTIRVSGEICDDVKAGLVEFEVPHDDEAVELSVADLVPILITVAQFTVGPLLGYLAARLANRSVRVKSGDVEIELKGASPGQLAEVTGAVERLRKGNIEILAQQFPELKDSDPGASASGADGQ